MEVVVKSGASVSEALEKAAAELGLDVEDLEYEIVEEKQRKFFGFGQSFVEIRAFPKNDPAVRAKYIATKVAKWFDGDAKVRCAAQGRSISIDIDSNSSLLIGKHGVTLNALQALLEVIAGRVARERVSLSLDIGGYRARADRRLEELARRMARKAVLEQRDIALRPMSARERWIVHNALAGSSQVYTESVGEEPNRRVVIKLLHRGTQRSQQHPSGWQRGRR